MIELPASNDDVVAHAINPALDLLPPNMASDEARVMLLAIGRQESAFMERAQIGGPARSLWQFERNGVLAVMHHHASAPYVFELCGKLGIPYGSNAIFNTLLTDDVLGAALARLLLWTDPRPLPAIGDKAGAWDLYERTWRPGKPAYSRWGDAYDAAVEVIG